MRPLLHRCILAIAVLALLVQPGDALAGPDLRAAAQAPEILNLVSQTGGASLAVAVQGNYAYLGVGANLQVIDIIDLTTPEPVESIPLPDLIRDICISGQVAYAAVGSAGVAVLDLSDPVRPVLVNTVDTAGTAVEVVEDGGFAYVADNGGGMAIFDVSNPAQPEPVSEFDTLGAVRGIAAAGNYAYLADITMDLYIIDVSDPSQPSQVALVSTPGPAFGVKVAGNYAYVAENGFGLRVIDISDPSQASLVALVETPGYAQSVYLQDQTAYVTDRDGNLTMIDITHPDQPALINTVTTSGHAQDVTAAGSYAYIADYDAGLTILDVRDPANAALAGSFNPAMLAANIAVSSSYAYVARYSGLSIFDLGHQEQPLLVSEIDIPGTENVYLVDGGYAYVHCCGINLEIFDITDPTQPLQVGTFIDTLGSILDLKVAGDTAYVLSSMDISVYDLAIPSQLTLINSERILQPARSGVLGIAGNYAYVVHEQGGMYIFDITNPAQDLPMVFHSDYKFAGTDVEVSGSYAYVIDSFIDIIDISDPAHPVGVYSFHTPGDMNDLTIDGGYLYVADGRAGLSIYDLTNPTAPTLVSSYNTPVSAHKVAVNGRDIFIAEGEGGWLHLCASSGKIYLPVIRSAAN